MKFTAKEIKCIRKMVLDVLSFCHENLRGKRTNRAMAIFDAYPEATILAAIDPKAFGRVRKYVLRDVQEYDLFNKGD